LSALGEVAENGCVRVNFFRVSTLWVRVGINFGSLTSFTSASKFVQKLTRDFGLNCGGEVELTTLAVAHFKNKEFERIGLKALAKSVLGHEMNKSKTVTMSNWSKSHLDRRQVEYACIDAWISHAIFEGLQNAQALAV
jgi:hypothetical protein